MEKIFSVCNSNSNLTSKRELKRFQFARVRFDSVLKLELRLESICYK